MLPTIEVVIYVLGLVVLTTIISIIFEPENRENLSRFKDLFFEGFHLNNAATFIGYTVFDFNILFLIMYVFSMIIYLFEHFFVIEDNFVNKDVKGAQIVMFIIGIIGQAACAYIILSKGEA